MKNSRRNRANAAAKAEKRANYQAAPRVWVDEARHVSDETVAKLANHFKGDA